jgi:2-dehydropantoate 2-reductase
VKLPADFVDARMRFADAAPPGFRASLAHDLERGNRLEIDWLAGKVVELGRALGVPTPANEVIYAVLKLHRMGSRSG